MSEGSDRDVDPGWGEERAADGGEDLELRATGRDAELVLRRREGRIEIISGGTFLISSENEASSRALIAAARPVLPDRPLDVLIGGLGLGYALDEALGLPSVRLVRVAELEPVIVEWFQRFGGDRALRQAGDPRVDLHLGDVFELLAPRSYDLIALDTDNGARWLVREANARIYREGLELAQASLRPGGVLTVWSPGYDDLLARDLGRVFPRVDAVEATDVVDGRALLYVMYRASLE